jgi:hypothetical protein
VFETTVPPKDVLDALTTQKLDWEVQVRKRLEAVGCAESIELLAAAEGVAAHLREQFPGLPAGRVVMAAAQSLATAAEVYGFDSLNVLLSVAGLAAEQLEREGADRG